MTHLPVWAPSRHLFWPQMARADGGGWLQPSLTGLFAVEGKCDLASASAGVTGLLSAYDLMCRWPYDLTCRCSSVGIMAWAAPVG